MNASMRVSTILGVALVAAACAAQPVANQPILIGVSGPLSGPNAQYGTAWKKGFDLALEEVNGRGGVRGRPLAYVFEDTQSDPKQTVVVAQKFINDPRVVLEIGDFASGASMAASPIYQRAGMVQFGFTNSHPDFTKGGDYMWSNSVTQDDASPVLADFASKGLGLKRVAVVYLNNDWGLSSYDIFARRAQELGLGIVTAEKYAADDKDFMATLTRIRDAKPDGLVMFSYYNDGAQIALQMEKLGLKLPMIGGSSLHSPNFTKLAGSAIEGFHLKGQFALDDPRSDVQAFIKAFKARYNGEEPDFFAAHAYDAMRVAAAVIEIGGTERSAIRDAFAKVEVPSVIYGTIKFDPVTRRVANPQFVDLLVQGGQFVSAPRK